MGFPSAREPSRELASCVAAFPEPEMRRVALGDRLLKASPAQSASLLSEILMLGREGGPPFDVTLAAFIALLSEPGALAYEGLVEIYRAARDQGLSDLAALFLSSLDHPTSRPAGRVAEGRDGRPLTLGERKTLARRSTRSQMDRLLGDPDPSVLRQLLLNPLLTDRDVVLLAARRPTSASAQRVLAQSRRFSARRAVRRALVMNPNTPTDLAARLCALLDRNDLAAIAAETSVAPVVRDVARRILAGRRKRHDSRG